MIEQPDAIDKALKLIKDEADDVHWKLDGACRNLKAEIGDHVDDSAFAATADAMNDHQTP